MNAFPLPGIIEPRQRAHLPLLAAGSASKLEIDIVIATCQFPVSGELEKNLAFILDLITNAKQKGAEIVHFSESCLSGYAGVDFSTFGQHQETLLTKSLNQVAALAARLKTWVILGSHYFVDKSLKPYSGIPSYNGSKFV